MSQKMSIPELMKMFNDIPRRGEMTPALAYTKPFQNRGHREYDVIVAGEALIGYYKRHAKDAMIRYERRRNASSTHSLEIAERFNQRAAAIEDILRKVRENENHQTVI